MAETLKQRFIRWWLNVRYPAYRGTGAWITYIAPDWREVRLKLPLNLFTRNYVGTIFGGSMFGATDPIYMLMLIRNLGRDYIVWDKAASIQYKKPAKTTLTATFQLDEAELGTIRAELQNARSLDRIYHVQLIDQSGVICAEVEKTLYIRRKDRE